MYYIALWDTVFHSIRFVGFYTFWQTCLAESSMLAYNVYFCHKKMHKSML